MKEEQKIIIEIAEIFVHAFLHNLIPEGNQNN